MNISTVNPHRSRQNGFVSIISVLALVLVVLIILQQNLKISSSKALTGLQQSDSVAALAIAQSGTEVVLQKLAIAARSTPNLTTICDSSKLGLATENANVNAGTPNSFSLVDAKLSVNGYCKIRVNGTLRSASRTIETWARLSPVYGSAGFGKYPTLQLTNTLGVAAVGVFNLGWGTNFSLGHDVSGTGNATCSDCLSTVWNDAVPGSANNVGGSGNYSQAMLPGQSASSTHTLSDERNFVMVGHILGGTTSSTPPTVLINATNPIPVTATNKSASQTLTTSAVTAKLNSADICNADNNANAMIIGISANGPDPINGQPNLTGHFNSATFNYNGGSGPGIYMPWTSIPTKNYIHYPDSNINSGLSTPLAWGDIFVEFYYYYQEPVFLTVAYSSGSKTTSSAIKDNTTFLAEGNYLQDQLLGRYIRPKNNSVDNGTYIISNTASFNHPLDATKKVSTITLSSPLSGTTPTGNTICSGICGFIPDPKTDMKFTFGKESTAIAAKSWIAGMMCLKGVNDNNVKPLTADSGITVLLWHEVLSTDQVLF